MSDVGKSAYLTRRKGSSSWYYRRRFPPDVVATGARPDFWLSLRTGNLAEAKDGVSAAEERYWDAVADARGRSSSRVSRPNGRIELRAKRWERTVDPRLPALTTEEARRLALSYFHAERARLDLALPFPLSSEQVQEQLIDAGIELAMLHDPDHPDALLWAEQAELRLLAENGLSSEPDSEASQLLHGLLRRAMVQLVALRMERARGRFEDRLNDRFFAQPGPAARSRAQPTAASKTIDDLIADYDRARIEPELATSKTKNKARATLTVIKNALGAAAPVHTITREICYAFRDTLGALPPNFTKKMKPRMALADLAESNRRSDGPRLSRATQATYIRMLSRLFEFAREQKLVADNVAENIPLHAPKRRKREQLRNAYSASQLSKIFNAPIYRGCAGTGTGVYKTGTTKIRDARFWVPLIALFSGLRMNEILQLTPDHVAFDETGEPYFRIDDEMQVKTENSYRVVPVHPELVRIGFLGFEQDKREAGAELLFDDVEPGLDGYRSTRFSKTYTRLVRPLKLDEPGRSVSFHSFRHCFRDALRLPDVNPDLVNELGGWSRGNDTSTSYGDGAKAAALRPLIERVRYDLDLSHLYSENALQQ
jgi:integrase